MRSIVGQKDIFLSYAHINIHFARRIKVGINSLWLNEIYVIRRYPTHCLATPYAPRKSWMMQTILSGSMRLVSGLDTSGGTRLQMEFRYTSSFKCSLRMSEVTHVGIDISLAWRIKQNNLLKCLHATEESCSYYHITKPLLVYSTHRK